jgi:hypothetical protein
MAKTVEERRASKAAAMRKWRLKNKADAASLKAQLAEAKRKIEILTGGK